VAAHEGDGGAQAAKIEARVACRRVHAVVIAALFWGIFLGEFSGSEKGDTMGRGERT